MKKNSETKYFKDNQSHYSIYLLQKKIVLIHAIILI